MAGAGTPSNSRAAGLLIAAQLARYGAQIATVVLLSRLIDPSDFGLVAMIAAFTGAAYIVADMGLGLAAIRNVDLTVEQRSNLFWINALIGVGVALTVALCAPLLAEFYGDARVLWPTVVMGLVFLGTSMGVQFRAELNREQRFRELAIMDVLGAAVGVVAGLTVALMGGGYWSLVLQQLAFAVAALIAGVVLSGWRPGAWHTSAPTAKLIKFGAGTGLTQLVNYASSNLDTVLIGRAQGAYTLGLYNRAFQVMTVPVQQLIAPLTRVVLPVLSGLVDSSRSAEFDTAARRFQNRIALPMLGIIAVLWGAAPELFAIAFGDEWAPSVPVFRVLALAAALQVLGYLHYWILMARDRTILLFASELPGRVFLVLGFIYLASAPIALIAWVVVAGYFLIWLSGLVFALPRAGFRPAPLLQTDAILLIPAIVAASAMWAVGSLGLSLGSIVTQLVAEVLIGGLVWLGISATLPSTRRELEFWISFVRKSPGA